MPPSRCKILTEAAELAVCCPEMLAIAEPEAKEVTRPLRLCEA